MKEIKPYKTRQGLEKAIDNGGRFYNLLSLSDDRVVTKAELAKAAGVFSSGSKACLFLAMAQFDLPEEDQRRIESMLEPGLRKQFAQLQPLTIAPSQIDQKGTAGENMIVVGHVRFVENKTDFNGFVMIPIVSGSVTTFTMVPIFDQYDVYELFDDHRLKKPSSIIAKSRGKRLETDGPIRFGGVLRELKSDKKNKQEHSFYLESLYYSHIGQPN